VQEAVNALHNISALSDAPLAQPRFPIGFGRLIDNHHIIPKVVTTVKGEGAVRIKVDVRHLDIEQVLGDRWQNGTARFINERPTVDGPEE